MTDATFWLIVFTIAFVNAVRAHRRAIKAKADELKANEKFFDEGIASGEIVAFQIEGTSDWYYPKRK